jgi:methylenetetrahydrofolate dehydrogenase (NADP+)/methenyltetrahydrofolate cyclohydrolase/formyltetrahydrofolate synthetase
LHNPVVLLTSLACLVFQVLKAVDELNKDSTIHGIIVQLPPDSDNPIDPATVTNAVVPEKDVDGCV